MGRAKIAGGVTAAVLAATTAFLMPWEGKENKAYLDRIAKPPVWTVCYGETDPKYAFKGAYYTDAQCKAMLEVRVAGFYARMSKVAKVDVIPVSVQASLLELMYNVGDGAFGKSTILKLANAGKYRQACAELDKWVKAGGVKVKGLVNRRNASETMCLKDVK